MGLGPFQVQKLYGFFWSISARQVPFRVVFKTNSDEVTVHTAPAAVAAEALTSELVGFPTGTIGFSLKYVQGTC